MKSEISAVERQMRELIEECCDIVDGSYLKTEDARRIINLLIKGLEKCKELRESRDNWKDKFIKLKGGLL